MVAAYPFGIPESLREEAVEAARQCLGDQKPSVKLFAAKLVVEFIKANIQTVRTLATDQVQRHVSFDKRDELIDAKSKALESMTDEELDALESLTRKAGGAIPFGEGNDADN